MFHRFFNQIAAPVAGTASEFFRRAGSRKHHLVLLVLAGLFFTGYVKRSRASRGTVAVPRVTWDQALAGDVSVPFVPEYDRSLNRLFMAVETTCLPEDLDGKDSIIRVAPEYTRITLIAHTMRLGPDRFDRPDSPLSRLRESIADSDMARRCSVVNMPRDFRGETRWMQDAGEGGGDAFLLGSKGGGYGPVLAQSGIRAYQHPLPLDGGNISLARNGQGMPIVFVGSTEYEQARHALTRSGRQVTDREIEQIYCRAFRAERLVVLPNIRDEHVDQNVLFLRDGLAAIECLPPMSDDDADALAEYRAATGHPVKDLETRSLPAYAAGYEGETRSLSPGRAGKSRVVEEIPAISLPKEHARAFEELRDCVPHLQDLIYADEFDRVRRETEALLRANGFEIVPLKTTVHARLNFQFHLNAMVYRHRETGQTEIIFPVYPERGREQETFDFTRPTGRNAANIATLASLGFRVRPVRGQYLQGGSTHCATYQF